MFYDHMAYFKLHDCRLAAASTAVYLCQEPCGEPSINNLGKREGWVGLGG